MQRGFFFVDDEAGFLLIGLNVPIDIHHAGRGVEDGLHGFGELQSCFFVRPINLGDECLQHWRAGWHLGDGDTGFVAIRDGGDGRANAFGDVVALCFALVLADEVDLDVGDVGTAAHEVVAHEAVEVVGRGDTGVDLVIGHFGFGADRGGHFAGDGGGLFQRRAFRHVQDDLELALVVKGQHLHLYPA